MTLMTGALESKAQVPRSLSESISRTLRNGGVLAAVVLYTVYSALPFLWVGTMSVRTTAEISASHFAWPETFHWEKFRIAWVDSNFAQYFWNSTLVVVSAVIIVTFLGAAAAHCLARYNFRGNRFVYFILFSSIVFPPQIIFISLFQVLVEYELYNTRLGLTLVYVSLQLPLTVYLLEAFFCAHPSRLIRCRKNGWLFRFSNILANCIAGRDAGYRHNSDFKFHPAME